MTDQQPRQPIDKNELDAAMRTVEMTVASPSSEMPKSSALQTIRAAMARLAEYESRLPRNAQGDIVLPGDELHEYDPIHGPMMSWADMHDASEVIVPGDADYGPMDFSQYHRTPELARPASEARPHRVDGIVVDPKCDDCGDRHEGQCDE